MEAPCYFVFVRKQFDRGNHTEACTSSTCRFARDLRRRESAAYENSFHSCWHILVATSIALCDPHTCIFRCYSVPAGELRAPSAHSCGGFWGAVSESSVPIALPLLLLLCSSRSWVCFHDFLATRGHEASVVVQENPYQTRRTYKLAIDAYMRLIISSQGLRFVLEVLRKLLRSQIAREQRLISCE